MKKEPRTLTVSYAPTDHPRLTLTGAWLRQFGFATGDVVSVTNLEPGVLVVKVDMPASLVNHQKQRERLERDLRAVEAELNYHKSLPIPTIMPPTITQTQEVRDSNNGQTGPAYTPNPAPLTNVQ